MTESKRKLSALRASGRLSLNPDGMTDAQAEILAKLFDLQDHLGGQDASIQQILDQAVLHNGRLTDVEQWVAEREMEKKKREDEEAVREGVRNALKVPFRLAWKPVVALVAIVMAGSSVKDFFGMLLEFLHHLIK